MPRCSHDGEALRSRRIDTWAVLRGRGVARARHRAPRSTTFLAHRRAMNVKGGDFELCISSQHVFVKTKRREWICQPILSCSFLS